MNTHNYDTWMTLEILKPYLPIGMGFIRVRQHADGLPCDPWWRGLLEDASIDNNCRIVSEEIDREDLLIVEKEPMSLSRLTIPEDKYCGDCGWPVIFALNNGMVDDQVDYWIYCSRKLCKNHEGGPASFPDDPDWVASDAAAFSKGV